MRRARVIASLIVLLPILALALASYVYLRGVSRRMAVRLPGIISAAASERINGDLHIGKVEIRPFGVALHDVTLTESAELGGRSVLTVPEARISCNLLSVARGADPVKAVRTVDILSPTIWVERLPDGRWNVSRLMKKLPPGKPLEFGGQVRVASARISIRDRLPRSLTPTANMLSGVNARIDFRKPRIASFTMWGDGPRGRLDDFTVRGQYNLNLHGFTADAKIRGLDARYFSTYPWRVGLNVLAGRVDADVSVSKPSQRALFGYSALVHVNDASVGFGWIRRPVDRVCGDVLVRDGALSMRLDGSLGSSAVAISGGIRDLKHTSLDLSLSADRANIREAVGLAGYSRSIKGIGLTRSGRVRASITGPPRSVTVAFEAAAPSITYAGLTGRSVVARGSYHNRRVKLTSASLNAYGARLEGAGTVDFTRRTTADIYGRATGLASDRIPTTAKHKLGIVSSGRFHAFARREGSGVEYRGAISDFASGGIAFQDGMCDITYTSNGVEIRELSGKTLGGLIAVSGKIGHKGELKLNASGVDINLAKAMKPSKKAQVVGRGSFSGQVTGTLTSPVFTGEVGGSKVMCSGVEMQRIAGKVIASRDKIVLEDVTGHCYTGSVSISGEVRSPLQRRPTVNLTIDADSLDISSCAPDVLPQEGLLSGEILVAGELRDPTAQANLRVDGGSWRGIAVDALEAHATYGTGTLTVHSLSARSGESSIIAEGSVSADNIINMTVRSEGLALEKLSDLFDPYVTASGNAAVSGSVTGTLDAPIGEIAFDAQDPTVNTRKFSRLSARLGWRDGVFSLYDLVLADANSEYSVPKMTYDPNSRKLAFDCRASNASAGKLLSMMESSPALKGESVQAKKASDFFARIARPFTGMLNGGVSGSIQFKETQATPDITADVAMSGMKLGLNTFDSVRVRGSWKGDEVKLESLDAREADMTIAAHGSVGPQDALDLRIEGQDLDVTTLCRWLGYPHNFSGKADVTLVASGTKHAPTSDIDISIANPTFGGARFDGLKSHLIVTEASGEQEDGATAKLSINEFALALGDRSLKVYGYMPLNLADFTVPSKSPFLIQCNLDSDSLAILSKFSGIAMQTGPSGSLEGEIKFGGTVESPKLEGNLAWTDGQVQIPRLNSPMQGITARLSLLGDKVSIQELTGRSSEGGEFVVTGGVSLAEMKPSLDLEIVPTRLGLSGRNISNLYGEDVRVKLNGQVKVIGPCCTPLVAGSLDVPEGSVALPSKPVKPSPTVWTSELDPRFELKAVLGSAVRFGAARFKSPVAGTLDIAGSLRKPVVDGTLDVSGGTIIFPMRRFKMLPGSSIALRTGSKGIGVQVDVTAQTRMSAYSEIGRRRMYSITMMAQGPLDKLSPDFSSSPPDLSEERIVALLAGQGELETLLASGNGRDFGQSISQIFSTALMPSVFEPIEESFESLGFEEFGLDVGYGEPVQLTIGKRLFGNVHLDYSAAFGARQDYSDSDRQLRLYYRTKRGLEFGVTTDENNLVTLGVEGTLRY